MRVPTACAESMPCLACSPNPQNFLSRWRSTSLGLVLALAVAAGLVSPCSAQVTSAEARRLGVEVAWQAQLQMPIAGQGIVSSHLWADPSTLRQYAVVELADRTIRVSADKLDRRGQPIGLAEAKKQASEQATRLMFGKSDGFEVVEVSVPQIYLVLVTRDGLVQNYDAETGTLLWSTMTGLSRAPAHPAAVSSAGVTLVHGNDLFLLDWASGRQLMSRPLRNGTSNAVAVCKDIAFVSDFTGQVEAYGLQRHVNPWSYAFAGRAVGHPVSSADQAFSAMATTAGYVYVFAGGEDPSLWLRYETSPTISGSLAAANGAFYAASTGGVLGKITLDNRLGTIAWEYRAGKSISQPALIIGQQVFVATEAGDLIAIDDQTGMAQWSLPLSRIKAPVAMLDNKVICTTASGQLVAVDSRSGRVHGQSGVIEMSEPILNQLNDRIYLVTTTGRLQCLRPIDGVLPNMVAPVAPAEKEAAATQEEPQTVTEPASQGSPFEGFGAPAANNPFGGEDPFGGGAAGANAGAADDPFGADPFGTDP